MEIWKVGRCENHRCNFDNCMVRRTMTQFHMLVSLAVVTDNNLTFKTGDWRLQSYVLHYLLLSRAVSGWVLSVVARGVLVLPAPGSPWPGWTLTLGWWPWPTPSAHSVPCCRWSAVQTSLHSRLWSSETCHYGLWSNNYRGKTETPSLVMHLERSAMYLKHKHSSTLLCNQTSFTC